ncbi:MAG: hypothetical protein ACJAY8_001399 [Sphingobacteriales bacterium]|jgi:hypothetical protein
MKKVVNKHVIFPFALLFGFFGLLNSGLQAQSGQLFVDTTANWITDHYEYEEYPDSTWDAAFNRLYFFEGTAILDGVEYQIIKSTCSYRYWFDTAGFHEEIHRCDTMVNAYIREDTALKKVFFHSSSPGAWDKCNRMLKDRLSVDPEAYVFEELAMDLSLDSTQIDEFVSISDRYRVKYLSKFQDYFGIGDSSWTFFVSGFYEYPVSPNWNGMEGMGGNLLESYGFMRSILYPVSQCGEFEGPNFFINFTTCYSKSGRFFVNAPDGKQHGDSGVCELRKPMGIAEEKIPANKPWLVNPTQGDIQFLQPITGALIVQDPGGRFVFQGKVQGMQKLSAQDWPAGLYLVHWVSDRGTRVAKVVLE